MIRILAFLLLFFLFSTTASPAQVLVQGTVTDASTGEPLPAANVLIEGTLQGTITNEEGQYALLVDKIPATLIFRYIGYRSAQRSITDGPEQRVDAALEPVAYELGELVVTGEDPAVAIMRRVIERKQQWRSLLDTFEAEAYTRFTLSNDTGIVSIVESLSQVFWDTERGTKEIVRSRRQTANVPFEAFLPAALFVSNLYDDNIEISGYRFIGVTHPDALDHYHFRLEGTRQMDGQVVYDISVEPQSRLSTAFTGRVAVLDSAFALLEVALRPSQSFLFPPPIQQYEVTFFQQFSDFGRDFQLPVDFRSETTLKIEFQGLLSFPPIRIRQVSRLTDYQVNVPIPDSLFERSEYLTVDSVSVASDTLLDQTGVSVPLEKQESLAYERIDSTHTMEEAYRPTGPLARFTRVRASSEEVEVESGGRRGLAGFNIEPQLWFNRVEGLHAGASTGRRFGSFDLTAHGGWSSELPAEKAWSGGIGTGLKAGQEENVGLNASFDVGPDSRYKSDLYTRTVTSVYLLMGGDDYFDYYWRHRLDVSASYTYRPLDARLTAAFIREWPDSLSTRTGFDFFGGHDTPRPNSAVRPFDVTSGLIRLQLGDDASSLGLTGRRFASFELEHGQTGFDSPQRFTRYSVDAEWSAPTLYRRRLFPAKLYVHVTAGGKIGLLPIQRYGIIEARLGPYSPFGVLRTLTGRPYEGDRYAGIFWEHHFRTIPFELLGLYGVAQKGYGILLHGGHVRTWASEEDFSGTYAPFTPDGFHHELGVSLSGLFGLFRLDLTTRLDAPGFTIGFGAARLF